MAAYTCKPVAEKKDYPRIVAVFCSSSGAGEVVLVYDHVAPYRYHLLCASTQLSREASEKLSVVVTGSSHTLARKVEKVLNSTVPGRA